jgi:RNA polymerase sigma-70 factor (ECF subfamily)
MTAAPHTGPESGSSTSTSISLLDGLKAQKSEAWKQFVELYTPRIYRWCRSDGLSPDDAADVVQEVFTSVVKGIGGFRGEQPCGSFRAWLRSITRHRVVDHFRRRQGAPQGVGGTQAQQALLQVPEPPEMPQSEPPAAEDDAVWRRALEIVGAEFEDPTWRAFWRTVVDGQSPASVANELGMSLHAVYKAKSRVLCRLRDQLGELEGVN